MNLLENVLFVISCECFLTCVDNAAAVDDEVGSIKDAFFLKDLAAFVVKKLVVGSTCNSAALEVGDCIVVNCCTESAGSENVTFCGENVFLSYFYRIKLCNCFFHSFAV